MTHPGARFQKTRGTGCKMTGEDSGRDRKGSRSLNFNGGSDSGGGGPSRGLYLAFVDGPPNAYKVIMSCLTTRGTPMT